MATSKKTGGAKTSKKTAGTKKAGGARPATGAKKAGAKKAGAKKAGAKKAAAGKRPARALAAAGAAAIVISFANNIAPLFTAQDVQCMRGLGVLLINYEYMSKQVSGQFRNAQKVLQMLKPGALPDRMPMGGPYWSDANIQLFSDWIAANCPP